MFWRVAILRQYVRLGSTMLINKNTQNIENVKHGSQPQLSRIFCLHHVLSRKQTSGVTCAVRQNLMLRAATCCVHQVWCTAPRVHQVWCTATCTPLNLSCWRMATSRNLQKLLCAFAKSHKQLLAPSRVSHRPTVLPSLYPHRRTLLSLDGF